MIPLELSDFPNSPYPLKKLMLTRFFRQINEDGPVPEHRPELGPCWEWLRSYRNSYGRFFVYPIGYVSTHRFSWEIYNGAIPDGLFVCHHCDNRKCCRPDHLFLGTKMDNIQDAVAKGRMASGDRSGAHTHPESVSRGADHYLTRDPSHPHAQTVANYAKAKLAADPNAYKGTGNGHASLTEDDVRAIKARRRSGEMLKTIAADYGVGVSLISKIDRGQLWGHVV